MPAPIAFCAMALVAVTIFSANSFGATVAGLALDDLARLATPTATATSPDGRVVAYTLIQPDSLGEDYRQGIWTVRASGGTPRRLVERGSTPRWSPDGRQIAYLARDGSVDGATQLWRISPDGGAPRRVTNSASPVTDFAWAPNGRTIAFTAAVVDSAGGAGRSLTQIHLVDLASGQVRQLTRIDRTIIVHSWDPDANLSWSPDGRRIAFSSKPSPRFDDDYESDVFVVSVDDREVRALVRRPGMDMRPIWSPDGGSIAFRSSFGVVDRFADHGIALTSPSGGEPRDIGRSLEAGYLDGPYQYAWSSDGRTLYFTAAESLATAIFAIDIRSGQTRRVSNAPAQRAALSVATHAPQMSFVMSEGRTPWEVYVSNLRSYQPRRLTRSNPWLERRTLSTPVILRWKSGAWELTGVLLRPVGTLGRQSPLLTVLHGGPEGSARIGFEPELPSPIFNYDAGSYPAQLYASHGYAVFFPNFRGSGGHGAALRRAGGANWSRTFLEDVVAGIDTLIRRGIADSTRLFLAGSRSGATKVVSLLTNSRRFRAAYVQDPYPDLVAEYGQSAGDFHLMYLGLFGGSPETAPDVYAQNSPINGVARITTPVQIAADEDAFSIPSSQSVLLHRRLLERGTPGELMLFRGRDIPANLELLRRNLAWFDRWAVRSPVPR